MHYLTKTFNKITNPNWNITVISITILLSVMLSIFVLSDPDSTSKIILNIYSKLSKSFEEIFIYGGVFLLLFLLGIAISKYGSIKVDMPSKPIYSIY